LFCHSTFEGASATFEHDRKLDSDHEKAPLKMYVVINTIALRAEKSIMPLAPQTFEPTVAARCHSVSAQHPGKNIRNRRNRPANLGSAPAPRPARTTNRADARGK
jgi:hypothetical protein